MAVSDVFRASPQLVSFLRFIVEAELGGRSSRLKGYTIAVEVLRRDEKFDPRIDPIVRVEAGRLRRAIERYYHGLGADDSIVIDLPLGGYAPTFRRRDAVSPLAERGHVAARAGARWLAPAARPLVVLAAALAAVVAAGMLIAPRLRDHPVAAAPPPDVVLSLAEVRPSGNGVPTMAIDAFDVVGAPAASGVLAASLRERIGDAFSRFDLVNVVEDDGRRAAADRSLPARHAQYRFGGSLEYDATGAARIAFRVVDTADNNVIWSQNFERLGVTEDRAAAEETIVRQLAATLLQRFGVLYAYARSRMLAGEPVDPRFRCILDASESFRAFDPTLHQRARACLEALTDTDTSFSLGFSYLALTYVREYQYGLGVGVGDPPVLDRALRAARRGVESSPASARAYEMLFVVLFARGDLPAAFSAGDKAMSLNRYDARLRGTYATRLIASGEIDKGMSMLTQAAADGSVLPPVEQFYLFLGNYLRGDLAHATFHAGQLTSDNFQLGLLARTLIASANGDRVAAARAGERLAVLNPAWRADPHGMLARFIASDAIIDRLARDLGAVGRS